VRELAKTSGISKSNVAKIRHQFVEKGVLQEARGAFKIRHTKDLEQELLQGYGAVLRPKLLTHRFRAAEATTERALERIVRFLAELPVR
jgi:hypothetical protein